MVVLLFGGSHWCLFDTGEAHGGDDFSYNTLICSRSMVKEYNFYRSFSFIECHLGFMQIGSVVKISSSARQ